LWYNAQRIAGESSLGEHMIDLGIVIVNWNTRDYLKKCLETVLASQGDFSYEVVVVDNASSDGSPDMVRQRAFPRFADRQRNQRRFQLWQ
jgi:GT2 family glycosyltransferase